MIEESTKTAHELESEGGPWNAATHNANSWAAQESTTPEECESGDLSAAICSVGKG